MGNRGQSGSSPHHPPNHNQSRQVSKLKPCWRLRGHTLIVSVNSKNQAPGGEEQVGVKPEKIPSWQSHHPATVLSPLQKQRLLFFLSIATGSVLLGSETCPRLGRETIKNTRGEAFTLLIPCWKGTYRKRVASTTTTTIIVHVLVLAVAYKESDIKVWSKSGDAKYLLRKEV